LIGGTERRAGFEVLDPGLCPERGQWGGLGFTVRLPGGVVGTVGCRYSPDEWRIGEREDGEDLGKIMAWMGSGLFPLSLISHIQTRAMAEAFLGLG
jgi:hypothetical protein